MTEAVPHVHPHSSGGSMGIDQVREALTKKYGPLPGYVYVVVAVSAAYLWHRYHGSGSGTATPTATHPAARTGSGDLTSGLIGGGSNQVPTPVAKTNAQWGTEAVNYLVQEKHANAGIASTAIARYLRGKIVWVPRERVLISEAIAAIGPPPAGVRQIKSPPPPPHHPPPDPHPIPPPKHPHPIPPPKKKPPRKPPKAHGTHYVVRSGDTLSGIASRFYGSAAHWTKIYDANKHVIGNNPNHIVPGMRLFIPADK